MSNAIPFVFGLGGGLALWQLARPSTTHQASTPDDSVPATCLIQVDVAGITIDGARVDVTEAVQRAKAVGHALVIVAQDAPASTYAGLMASLREARVATQVRNVSVLARNAGAEPLSSPRGARRPQRYTLEGRTILRDGEAIMHMERVDLGNARYALSPYHADRLAQRVVALLNRYGAR